MTKQDIIKQVKLDYAEKRRMAQLKCDNYIEKLKKDPSFASIYLNYNIANLNYIKAKHNNSENLNEMLNTLNANEEKLNDYLKQNNLQRARLQPRYNCKLCEDKGIANGKMCTCLQEEINKRLSQDLSTYNNFHTFDMINQNLMNENLNKIYKDMFDWCESFPNTITNINFFGTVGAGKTFLLECICSKLLERGFNIIFVTAFAFNEECRKYHFGQPNNVENFINCDCLIIDDLGTEPMLKNITQEYFYNIINLRQVNRKSTLISSNLTPFTGDYGLELVRRYTERTISRLMNKQLSKSFMFNSIDKRV